MFIFYKYQIGRKRGFESLLFKAFVSCMYDQNRKILFFHVNPPWEQGILVHTFRTFPESDYSPLSIISNSHLLLGLFHWSVNWSPCLHSLLLIAYSPWRHPEKCFQNVIEIMLPSLIYFNSCVFYLQWNAVTLLWSLKVQIWPGSQLWFWLCLLPLPSVSVTIALFLFLEYNTNVFISGSALAVPFPWNAFDSDI